jgi:hypothetical protein
MSNLKINETHIMVIRKDDCTGRLHEEYLPLTFKDQAKLNKLEKYAKEPGVKGEDVYYAAKERGLGYLLEGYNFCPDVDGSYQGCPPIPLNEVKNGYLKDGKRLINALIGRTIPYCLSEMYRECRKDPSIVAYSTRFVGWSKMDFELSNDLSIAYYTNFGYGYANYFTANLKYKDIDILPYSMWVTYYNANISQILRYTRTYYIDNSEWEKALKFGCEISNSLLDNPSDFANKWLVGEVKKMVEGLRSIFNNHGATIAVNMSNGSARTLTTKEEIVLFKGEKMSGALSFLSKIKEIEKLNVSMDYYIESILNMNREMVPELQDVINEYNIKISELKNRLEKLLIEKEPIEDYVNNHLDDCMDNFLREDTYSAKQEAEKIMCEISTEFNERNSLLKVMEHQESEMNSKLWNMQHVVNTLSGYVDTINAALETEYALAV